MAIFDPRQQRMCVRIVYDGVAGTGKTTNLRHLCSEFPSQRRTELFTPWEVGGRTLFFDWVQIAAGVVCGFPLVCQVISAPGQVVLTPRRRHLLGLSDVVVYVCDSSEGAAAKARDGLAVCESVLRERQSVPLVIQANKQDQPDALDGPSLARALGRPDGQVVEAIATDGVGVVATFVAAVRHVTRALQTSAHSDAVRIPVRLADTPAHLLARVSREEVDPEWAAEMLLEEVSDALHWDDIRIADLVSPAGARATPAPTRAASRPAGPPSPTLPSDAVPAGFVWPGNTGRSVLRAIDASGELPQDAPRDDDGVTVCTTSRYELRTSSAHRFLESDAARQALVRAARWSTQLGRLLVPGTVLVVTQSADGMSWLWTVRPRITPVREWFRPGTTPPPRALDSLATAVVEGLMAAGRHGLPLHFHLQSFGDCDGLVRYVGPLDGSPRPSLGADLVALVGELAPLGPVLMPFVTSLENGISTRLSEDELARLDLAATLSGEPPASPLLCDVRDRLRAAVARACRAA